MFKALGETRALIWEHQTRYKKLQLAGFYMTLTGQTIWIPYPSKTCTAPILKTTDSVDLLF